MAKVSERTVRVTDIPFNVQPLEFFNVAKRLSSRNFDRRLLSSAREGNSNPSYTLSTQFDGHVGTITFPSQKHKNAALQEHDTEWTFDDKFSGVTVLASPPGADVDVCAVHGLNGNAFDTWVASTNQKMWLRDLLPHVSPFDKARVMTFGYSSQLSDSANLSGLSEWAHHLLFSVSSVRQSHQERQRPLLFICYSMGGLVARQAMVRLHEYSHKSEYAGINLKSCGLLFLSTPHSGTKDADWSQFLVGIGQLTTGIRPDIIAALRSSNLLSTESQEDFANIKPQPPYESFYETSKTKVGGFNRLIVTRQSASLNGSIATSMADVDHKTICKFSGKFGGFMQVAEKLNYLRSLLLSQTAVVLAETTVPPVQSKAWFPPATAMNCYVPPDKKFFEGKGLNEHKKLRGRALELDSLKAIIDTKADETRTAVAITGIGGIGKTATVKEAAHQLADQRNIFYIHAHNAASLHQAYLHIARRVGPEYLLKEFRGRDLLEIWSNESSEDKVERFKAWLEDPENAETLFILDDMDGLQELNEREAALPPEAKNILYTTRNPVFRESNTRSRHKVRLATMTAEDIVNIMEEVRDSESNEYDKTGDLYDRATLLQIANALHGHPLAASIAVKYIIRVSSQYKAATAGNQFIAMLNGNSFRERREFLDFSPEVPSIMETFQVSQKRLNTPNGQAWVLMQFSSILETSKQPGSNFDPREFFFNHACSITPQEFPDHELLGEETFHLRALFSELETVSFGERIQISKPFQFHPLWLECTRHAMGPAGRIRYIRQAILVCYNTIFTRSEEAGSTEERTSNFLPHVRHCLRVCKSFRIELQELDLPESILVWLQYLDNS